MVRAVLFSRAAHAALVTTGVSGTLVMGLAFRHRRGWAVPLVWVVPAVLVASFADLALALLSSAPALAAWEMDGRPGDAARYALTCFLLLPPVEISYQLAATRLAGAGPRFVAAPAGSPGAVGAPAPPGMPQPAGDPPDGPPSG
jgi:hypothetical protein